MCHRSYQNNLIANPATQRGSMLVIDLFVIIVLALLGLTMTRLLSSSSETIIYEVLGQRALNAARSGAECALAANFNAPSCTALPGNTFIGVAGLENCSYEVFPTTNEVVDVAKTFDHLTFTSIGTCTAGNINVTRTVYVDAMVSS